MAFAEIRFKSAALDKATAMNVILPKRLTPDVPEQVTDDIPNGRRAEPIRYPVFYLLHGLSDDHTIWERRTRIEWYVRDLPLIVVMPDAGRSFYCDAVEGAAGERLILEDVIGFVESFLPTIAERGGRAIGGLSMGGYGAVKLGLKYPDRFCSVTAHSGCHSIVRELADYGTLRGHEELDGELFRIYGRPPRADDDPLMLADQADPEKVPAFRIDCGVDDFLIEHSRELRAKFEEKGIAHEYAEFPGQHDWDYWDAHVREAIDFHWQTLGRAIKE
jgi:S-formylglutathione hydrolase FrmB